MNSLSKHVFHKEGRKMSGMRGWVYIITNKSMPGLLKVGFSTNDPALRAGELDNTGVPHPYEVVWDALVERPREIEKLLHQALGEKREAKEWFRCSIEYAIKQFSLLKVTYINQKHYKTCGSDGGSIGKEFVNKKIFIFTDNKELDLKFRRDLSYLWISSDSIFSRADLRSALDFLRNSSVDLILANWYTKSGPEGEALMRELKRNSSFSKVPFVITTSFETEARRKNFKEVLIMPYHFNRFGDLVRKHLLNQSKY